jgi:integrase
MRHTRTRYQQGSLTKEERRSGPNVWIFRHRDGQNINRKTIVGTVEQYPTKTAARKATEHLRMTINSETFAPRTVSELIAHYIDKELAESGKKAYSTRHVYGSVIKTRILPEWGELPITGVKTVAVEAWLAGLALADASKAKIRNIMSAIFNHAMRYEWTIRNPITLVRQSAKRQRVPEILIAEEIKGLLAELQPLYRTAVYVAAVTGLRVSELLALRWEDVSWDAMEIQLSRGIFHQRVGDMKTEASKKPIALGSGLAEVLMDWRGQTPYNQHGDWIFASSEMQGKQPYWPDSLMRRVIRPAAVRAGITKHIGWHTFRHSLATLLKANGEDVKTVQESLRHANSKITLDTYTQGIMGVKRAAQSKVFEALREVPAPGIQ